MYDFIYKCPIYPIVYASIDYYTLSLPIGGPSDRLVT